MWRSSTLFASIILVSEEYNFTQTCNKMRKPATISIGHQFRYDCDSIDSIRHYIRHFGSTANTKDRRRKNIRIREKIVYTTKLRIQKSSDFMVSTLNSGFKIFGDMTKPRRFRPLVWIHISDIYRIYIGFVHLCVKGKTNPVLKRSGFITNQSGTISSSVYLF